MEIHARPFVVWDFGGKVTPAPPCHAFIEAGWVVTELVVYGRWHEY